MTSTAALSAAATTTMVAVATAMTAGTINNQLKAAEEMAQRQQRQ
jgi:hypothetical protein